MDIPPLLVTHHPVRPATAARLNRAFSVSHKGTTFASLGNEHFTRTNDGPWLRVRRAKNPAYYVLPGYQMLVDCSLPAVKILVVRYDRRVPWGETCRQFRALAKREGMTGFVGGWHDCEGTDARHWDKTKWPRFHWVNGTFKLFVP